MSLKPNGCSIDIHVSHAETQLTLKNKKYEILVIEGKKDDVSKFKLFNDVPNLGFYASYVCVFTSIVEVRF